MGGEVGGRYKILVIVVRDSREAIMRRGDLSEAYSEPRINPDDLWWDTVKPIRPYVEMMVR